MDMYLYHNLVKSMVIHAKIFKDSYGLLAKSTGAPQGKDDGHIVPSLSNTSIILSIINYS